MHSFHLIWQEFNDIHHNTQTDFPNKKTAEFREITLSWKYIPYM